MDLSFTYEPLLLDWITLERTLGFVGAVIMVDTDLKAELFTEYVFPPPRERTALAWSM